MLVRFFTGILDIDFWRIIGAVFPLLWVLLSTTSFPTGFCFLFEFVIMLTFFSFSIKTSSSPFLLELFEEFDDFRIFFTLLSSLFVESCVIPIITSSEFPSSVISIKPELILYLNYIGPECIKFKNQKWK